jgi:hypothetical protein
MTGYSCPTRLSDLGRWAAVCFEVNFHLPQYGAEFMAERMPPNSLRDTHPCKRGPDVAPKDHVGLDWL